VDTLAFLKAVWPSTGLYCIAHPIAKGYAHEVFDSIERAAAFAARKRETSNVFFAVHTLAEAQVWNEKKFRDKDTGEWTAGWSVRLQRNMRAAKCFFFDLDVGEGAVKYATRREALADLQRFCAVAQLPTPLVVTSGGGLHVYWLLEDEIASNDWVITAEKLFALARHFKLRVDASRTTDVSSVLRVVGTFNLKKAERRPVIAMTKGVVSPNAEFIADVDAMVAREGLAVASNQRPKDAPAEEDGFGSNIGPENYGPPVTMKQLATACGQVRQYIRALGDVDYALWHKMSGLIRHVEDGRAWFHKVSSGKKYDPVACDAKLDEQEARDIGPTTCLVLEQLGPAGACTGCFFYGKVRSPIVAARWPQKAKDPAPAPAGDPEEPGVEDEPKTENYERRVKHPAGFYLTDKGVLVQERKNKEGVMFPAVILGHDLYPAVQQVDNNSETDQHLWVAKLPRGVVRTFTMDSSAIHQEKALAAELSKRSIYVLPDNVKAVQTYMSAYIQDLQKDIDAEVQRNHLGWVDGRQKFVMSDAVLLADGTTEKVSMARDTRELVLHERRVGKAGTLERQIELLKFYDKPEYIGHQMIILAGLAAPTYFATGHAGCILNAHGKTGGSKSSALKAAASLWGHPDSYVMSATKGGSTFMHREKTASTLCNLPICLDEVTNMPDDQVKEFALGVSQSSHAGRLRRNGQIREVNHGQKSTIWLTSSNKSLHTLLSHDNAAGSAGSMRVIEFDFPQVDRSSEAKAIADDFLFALNHNYGHIGEAFMKAIMQDMDAYVELVRQTMKRLDKRGNIAPSERFWSSMPAAAIAAGHKAKELGLICFDIDKIEEWFLFEQLPLMRSVVADEYPTPLSALSAFIEKISGNTVIATKGGNVSRTPNGAVYARYEPDTRKLWIVRDAFKDHCVHRSAPFGEYVRELTAMHVIVDGNARKVLGQGTEVEKGRSYCFQVNMNHPEMCDSVIDIEKGPRSAAGGPHKFRVVD
jgi:hypothetical protein